MSHRKGGDKMAQQIIDLFAQSTIVQAIVTVMLIATCCYLWASQFPVPGELLGFTGAVLGFWFGTKAQQLIQKSSATSRSKS